MKYVGLYKDAQDIATKANVDAVQTDVNTKVPNTRKVNGHALSADVTVSKSDVGLGNVDNVKQYSASNPPPYPVTSVNGQTGAVTVKGVEIVMQAAQPTDQSTGDFWYQTTT